MKRFDTTPIIRQDLFGLSSVPFIKAPHEPYLDDNRQSCLDKLHGFLQTRGFAAVAGRPGTGKTVLVRHLTETLHQPTHKIAYIPFTHLSENDLLRTLCIRLQIEPPHRKGKAILAIQERIAQLQPANVIIVFDEMQGASLRIMEAVRLLANDNFDLSTRASFILMGTTEFYDQLRLAINESLRQRITCYHLMQELDEPGTVLFLRHCLSKAGAEQEIFEPSAVKLIHDLSEGRPRIISKLALSSLAAASKEQTATVLLAHVHIAKGNCILPKLQVTS